MDPLSSAMVGAVVSLVRDAPVSPGKVEFSWRLAVGPALHRATAVRLEQGVLLVDAASAQWAQEVRRSSGLILRRLQELLGQAVTRIEVRRLGPGDKVR
jgi:predicted nucleic acid-binding Zn ribbon protein